MPALPVAGPARGSERPLKRCWRWRVAGAQRGLAAAGGPLRAQARGPRRVRCSGSRRGGAGPADALLGGGGGRLGGSVAVAEGCANVSQRGERCVWRWKVTCGKWGGERGEMVDNR